ncbi:MAG: hypothetical protein FH749_10485 [Firmicutes bacterium]|nr:hypothetical protein [Bacillota bacterium]
MELMQNSQFRAYVQAVCEQIRWQEVHGEVARELATHVEETAQEYVEQGLETDTAIVKALERMGDAAVVGADLNKVHRPKPDWLLVGLTIMLAGFGFLIAQVWDLGMTNWLFICIGLALAVVFPERNCGI